MKKEDRVTQTETPMEGELTLYVFEYEHPAKNSVRKCVTFREKDFETAFVKFSEKLNCDDDNVRIWSIRKREYVNVERWTTIVNYNEDDNDD